MRICHVVYSYYPFDPRVRREVVALRAAGNEVDVLCLRDEDQPKEELLNGVRVHRVALELARGSMLRYAFQYAVFLLESTVVLFWLHLRFRFDVIHVHSLPDFQVLCAVPEKALGARLVLDFHEAMPEILAARFGVPMNSLLVLTARALETLSGLFADRVVTVNDSVAKILELRGIDRHKLFVVMNSPDLVPDDSPPKRELQERLGLVGRTVIVYAGGINPERDLGTVVRAASILAASRPVSLLMFGKGDQAYRQLLIDIARGGPGRLDLRVEDWIPSDRVFEYLALTEVGVAPYCRNPLTEIAMPNKVFEYAAARKPMVVSNLETMRALWDGAALFYEPGDAADLAHKIRRILDERELAPRLVEAAFEVYDRHRWARYRGELLNLYASLVPPRKVKSSASI